MAIDDLLDEHEQSERVRKWLKDNGVAVIGGIGLALAVIYGFKGWQQHRLQQSELAQARYDAAVTALSAPNPDLTKATAVVAGVDGKGVFPLLAQLQLAGAQANAGKTDDAIATLRRISDAGDLQPLVNQRLARLLIQNGKNDDALKALGDAGDAASLDVRGDALLAAGKPEQARDAWQKALVGLDVASPQRKLIELKLAGVGGTAPNAEHA